MFRFFFIIVLLGAALASGAWGLNAYKEQTQETLPEPEPVTEYEPTTIAELIAKRPSEDGAFELQNFHFAKEVVGVDLGGEPDWDHAYIPLFANDILLQTHNYKSVIYRTDTLRSEKDVEAFFENKTLEGFYAQQNQQLSNVAFGKLAKRYGGLDYKNCVIITSDMPEEPQEIETYWFGLMGFAGLLALAGFQSIGLIGDIQRRISRNKSNLENVDPASIFAGGNSDNSPPKYQSPS